MSKKYEDYDYEEDNSLNKNSNLVKKVLIVLLIIIAIVIVIYLLKGCNRDDNENPSETPVVFSYEETLIDAAKKYLSQNDQLLPTSAGECNTIYLSELISNNLIDLAKFSTCNLENTYIRICMLENGNIQYTPWLTCADKNSENEYDQLRNGTLSDVIQNETYVDFKFLPQLLNSKGTSLGKVEEMWKSDITYSSYKTLKTTNYYRFRDKLYTWKVNVKSYFTTNGEENDASKVNQYFTIEPNKSYTMYDSKTTNAYKWYTRVYALKNGSKNFSMEPLGEYNEKGEVVEVKYYQTAKDYVSVKPVLYYECVDESNPNSGYVVYSRKKCSERSGDGFKVERKSVWVCTGESENLDEIKDDKVPTVVDKIVDNENSACYKINSWNKETRNACDTNDLRCKISHVDKYYTWYKRSYYPSGAKTATEEKAYYEISPVDGAIKDIQTNANAAYKWYRLTETTTANYTATAPAGYESATKTEDYKWSNWSDWSTTNPKVNDGRSRSIETKSKIKLQQILGTTDSSWKNLTPDFVSKDEMIKAFNDNKFNVNSLTDINNNGEIKYQIKMFVRNKKEASK